LSCLVVRFQFLMRLKSFLRLASHDDLGAPGGGAVIVAGDQGTHGEAEAQEFVGGAGTGAAVGGGDEHTGLVVMVAASSGRGGEGDGRLTGLLVVAKARDRQADGEVGRGFEACQVIGEAGVVVVDGQPLDGLGGHAGGRADG